MQFIDNSTVKPTGWTDQSAHTSWAIDQSKNMSIFYHCYCTDIYLILWDNELISNNKME